MMLNSILVIRVLVWNSLISFLSSFCKCCFIIFENTVGEFCRWRDLNPGLADRKEVTKVTNLAPIGGSGLKLTELRLCYHVWSSMFHFHVINWATVGLGSTWIDHLGTISASGMGSNLSQIWWFVHGNRWISVWCLKEKIKGHFLHMANPTWQWLLKNPTTLDKKHKFIP